MYIHSSGGPGSLLGLQEPHSISRRPPQEPPEGDQIARHVEIMLGDDCPGKHFAVPRHEQPLSRLPNEGTHVISIEKDDLYKLLKTNEDHNLSYG